MISFSLSELSEEEKILMLKREVKFNGAPHKIDWEEIKKKKSNIIVEDEIYKYVVDIENIIQSLENKIYISARCMKQIIDLAKGWAIINEKEYVTHQDIKETLPFILRHRIKFLRQENKVDYINKEVLEKININ